ncbi:MAG: GNAT family N-acetyltransferase [Candidatus Velthaea sp.]|jgi:GNAT superfamily N-acetyltransferase
MYIDNIPDLAQARRVRASARGIPIREGDRAVAVAYLSDGTYVSNDTIVRFDVAQGENPGRRFSAALAATGARGLWFYGGDDAARRAAVELNLSLTAVGMAFVRRMDPVPGDIVLRLRPPALHDRMTLAEIVSDHAVAFASPEVSIVERDRDIVGVALTQVLEKEWTEVRVVIAPTYRGRGLGSAAFAAIADRLEAEGRLVCASLDTMEARGRSALERAGFRIADYYFNARRAR